MSSKDGIWREFATAHFQKWVFQKREFSYPWESHQGASQRGTWTGCIQISWKLVFCVSVNIKSLKKSLEKLVEFLSIMKNKLGIVAISENWCNDDKIMHKFFRLYNKQPWSKLF